MVGGIRCVVGVVAVAAFSAGFHPAAHAQLVFGSTTPTTTNPAAIYLDVTTGQTTTLWNSAANKKVNGAAADLANGRLYTNDAARLNFWDFGSVGTAPTFIAGMYRTNDNVTFTATGVDSLAWANGKLYGGTSFGSTVFKRGIYEISTVSDGMATPHSVMTPRWLDPTGVGTSSGTLILDGLDFNAADGLFYATQTADTTATGGIYTRGIYSIDVFGTGALTKLADFPAGVTGADGLAIGGGMFWLTDQVAGNNVISIYPFDPVTLTYGTTITVPLPETVNRATGATWAPGALTPVPEPGSLAMIAAAGATAVGVRRRRQGALSSPAAN
ncbi:MAG TPA: PEP-CTERM sorting domain-containing protein [Gemmataceae bacterium]|jgi:hypothetical protein